MSKIYNPSGGYRKLHAFNFASIIHLGTISLSELQGDLEDYLVTKGSIPWSIHSPDHQAVLAIMLDEFAYTDDLLHDYWVFLLAQKRRFDLWLESAFVAQGGIKEKMFAARVEARAEPAAPQCPECGAAMVKRTSARGEFWGCGTYPQCKGVRRIESVEKK